MTDAILLRKIIDEQGIKMTFIADKLRMSRQRFSKILEDGSDFKAWQMIVLKEILHLTDEQARAIFFKDGVGK